MKLTWKFLGFEYLKMISFSVILDSGFFSTICDMTLSKRA